MDVDTHVVLVRQALDLPEHLLRAVFHGVRAEATGDAPLVALVVFLHKADVALQLALAHGAVQRDQLAGGDVHRVARHLVDHVADTGARAQLDVVVHDPGHRGVEVAERRRAGLEGLDDVQAGTDDIVLVVGQAQQRQDAVYPPDLTRDILRTAAHDHVAGVDMRIDEARHHGLAGRVDQAIRRVALHHVGRLADGDDLAALDGDGAVVDDPRARALHRDDEAAVENGIDVHALSSFPCGGVHFLRTSSPQPSGATILP